MTRINTDGFVSETLSANRTIVAEDPALLAFDCNGSFRTVTLPTPTDKTPTREIANISGTVDEGLYVVDHDGFIASIVTPGGKDKFRTDGTNYFSDWAGGKVLGRTLFNWGAGIGGTIKSMRANGQAEAGNVDFADDPDDAWVSPFDSVLSTFGARWSTAIGDANFRVFKENREVGGVKVNGRTRGFKHQLNDHKYFFKTGESIGIPNNVATGQTNFQMLLKQVAGTTKFGAILPFGANLTTTGNYTRANGIAAETQVASSTAGITRVVAPIAGQVLGVVHHVATTGGRMRLHKNGVDQGFYDITTAKQVTILGSPLSFSAGDYWEIFHNTSTLPGLGIYGLITDMPGLLYMFGGNHASNVNLDVWGIGNTALTTTDNQQNEVILMEPGNITSVAWSIDSAANQPTLSIHVNGTSVHSTFIDNVPQGADETADDAVLPGDILQAVWGSNNAGQGIISVYIGPS